jgi:hypothetical protein
VTRWTEEVLIGAVGGTLVTVGVTLGVLYWRNPGPWMPSIACNCFTSGLVILTIDLLGIMAEHRREEQRSRAEKALTRGLVTATPLLGVTLAIDILRSLQGSQQAGKKAVERWQPTIRRLNAALRDDILYYSRWLDIEAVFALDLVQSSLAEFIGDDHILIDPVMWLAADGVLQGAEQTAAQFDLSSVKLELREFSDERQRIRKIVEVRAETIRHAP